MNTDAANPFNSSYKSLRKKIRIELQNLIQKVLNHPDFNPAEVDQRKVCIGDAGKRAAETLKRRREERRSNYCARRSQKASEESASD